MLMMRPRAKFGSPKRARTCAAVGESVVPVAMLRPAAAVICATQGPLAAPAWSQVPALVPQKQFVVSPALLQAPPRMQTDTASQSGRPTASVMPQQPSVDGLKFAMRHEPQVAASAAGGL